MNIKKCFAEAARMGVIEKEDAERLSQRYDEIVASSPDAAEARDKMIKELEAEAKHRERAALLTEVKRAAIIDVLQTHTNNKGEVDALEAWLATHEDFGRRGSFVQDAKHREEVIFNAAQSRLREVMKDQQRHWLMGDLSRTSKWFGQGQQASARNIAREVFGADTGSAPAKSMATAWLDVIETLRQRFNQAGGAVGKLAYGYLPQGHNRLAIMQARETLTDGTVLTGKAAWVHHMMKPGVLHRDRMVNPLTGIRLDDAQLRRGLEVAYDRIVTDGLIDKDVTAAPTGRGALYTQHADHRFLHFQDADAWFAYAERFGNRDVFGAMMGHVKMMSRDIAHMEIFGPNPNAMHTYVGNWLMKRAAGNPELERATKKAIHRADEMWKMERGVDPVDEVLAQRYQSVRNFISGTALPFAWFSSLSDVAAGQDARLRFGMTMGKSNLARIMVDTLRGMVDSGRHDDMVEAMLGVEAVTRILQRKAGEIKGWDHSFWTGWIADRTVTTGLLSPWTESGKHGIGRDLMTFLGGKAGTAFSDLDARLQRGLAAQGIDGAAWEKIRSAPLHDGKRLRPNEVMTLDRDLGELYLQMILRETQFAVPEATVQSTSIMRGSTTPGTHVGEIIKSMGQLKGFAVAVMQLNLMQWAREHHANNGYTNAAFVTSFLMTSMILGGMTLAIKDILRGQDPRKVLDDENILDWKFWGAALLQSGGLGIYGDFLFSDVNRFGGGIESTVPGPLFGRLGDIQQATIGVAIKAMSGEKTHAGRHWVNLARRNIPFTNMFLWSAAYQRLLMDAAQRSVDPEFAAWARQRAQKRQKDYKQGSWWPEGHMLPDRAPDLSRILSTR